MDRRRRPDPAAEPPDPLDPDEEAAEGTPEARPSADALVKGLPVAGVSRRRIAFLVGTLVTAWVIIVFARQVGDAAAASGRADAAAIENGRMTEQVAALQRELELVGTSAYIEQQARGYGLGARGEIAFRLAPGAPALPPDAPGSAALRVGSPPAPRSPLESWLTLLFGSGR